MIELDLARLPLGDVPRCNDPFGEFHCIRPDPRYAGWHEPTLHWTWKGSNWRTGRDPQGRFIEQLHESRYNNTLIVCDAARLGVRFVAAEVWFPRATQEVGLVFAYRTALDYLCLHMDRDGFIKLSRRAQGQFDVLGQRAVEDWQAMWLSLRVERERRELVCFLDIVELFRVAWPGTLDGKLGLLANCPARFRCLRADGALSEATPKRVRPPYPKMRVVRKIKTPGFGTARQIRFGDLTGNGRPDIVLAQKAPIKGGAGYWTVGCLTALTAEGEVLWQSGTPTPQTPLASDLPFQVNDIDGDGRNEVICVRGFEIQVLDGATGKVKYAAPTPERPAHHPLLKTVVSYFGSPDGHEFPRVAADAIRFADLTGRGAARDLLLKDRYHHLWAFTPEGNSNPHGWHGQTRLPVSSPTIEDTRKQVCGCHPSSGVPFGLRLLWSYCGNLGHFPFAADLNGDGRDEVAVGYHLLSADGADLQSHHLGDHADAVFAGDIQGWGEPKVIRAGGDDGFLIAGRGGDLLTVHHGHVQRLSIAKFHPDAPGLQYAICTYWGAPGIVALLDSTGKVLWSREYPVCGNTLQPVNWTGDGTELIYFSAHADHGGLYGWLGEQVVPFPRDGHPELCSEVLDLLGSGRDNLIVWDPERLWIYAPADDAEPRYRPKRPPLHSWSNYMCYWSLPAGT